MLIGLKQWSLMSPSSHLSFVYAVFPNEGDPDSCWKYYRQFDKEKLPTHLVTYFDTLFLWRDLLDHEIYLEGQIQRLRAENCKRLCKGAIGEPTSQHSRPAVLLTATIHLCMYKDPMLGYFLTYVLSVSKQILSASVREKLKAHLATCCDILEVRTCTANCHA